MKKVFMFIFISGVFTSIIFGQVSKDSIRVVKVFGGYQFLQGSKILSMNQLIETMKPNDLAHSEIVAAKRTYTTTMVLSYAGGFLIGYPIGTALAGGKPNWVMAAIGGGLVIIALPLSQKFGKQVNHAVETYNDGLNNGSFPKNLELSLAFQGNGILISLRF